MGIHRVRLAGKSNNPEVSERLGEVMLELSAAEVTTEDPPLVLRAIASDSGGLREYQIGEQSFHSDDRLFEFFATLVGGATDDAPLVVQVEASAQLKYQDLLPAIAACSGRYEGGVWRAYSVKFFWRAPSDPVVPEEVKK